MGDIALRNADKRRKLSLAELVLKAKMVQGMFHELNNTYCIYIMQAVNTLCQLHEVTTLYRIFAMDWRERFKLRFELLKSREGLTQEKLAESLGVTQGTVGHWLNARRAPDTLAMYEQLAKALGVSPAWLLYGIDQTISQETLEFAKLWERLPASQRIALHEAVRSLVKQIEKSTAE
jgi:transcriptional regulator with XRE-family HTH domain